jgi:outer membrane protein assembly factor BamA
VEVDSAQRLAHVVFHVALNRSAKFGDVRITGVTAEDADRLRATLGSLMARIRQVAVRPGKKYSFNRLEKAADYMERSLADQQYLAAQVRLTGADYNPETRRADILFDVTKGPLVDVRIEGANVSGGTRRRILPIYQQSGLTPELIQEGRQNLITHFQSEGYFDVAVEVDVDQQPDRHIVRYAVNRGRRTRLVDFEFSGNRYFSEDELEGHVAVEKARFFSYGEYDEDSIRMLEAAYHAAGFNSVEVTPEFITDGGRTLVTFVINEGPQDTVASFQITGNSIPQDQLAPDGLAVAPGAPYSQKSIDDDRNKIVAYYLDHGYLNATLVANAEASTNDPHRFRVVYEISEGPQVHTSDVIVVGGDHTKQKLIEQDIAELQPGTPLTERQLLASESRLYTRGVFDWAEVNPRRQITRQDREAVIVKLHEAKRNTLTYGLGYEITNRGGSVPAGTVAVPGLPPIGISSEFRTSQRTIRGPRASFLYTRTNVRGKAETITLGALGGPLVRRLNFTWSNPTFRWTKWSANYTSVGEINKENPVFNSRLVQFAVQLQRPLDDRQTKTLILRYSLTRSALTDFVIPDLIAAEDRNTRLSTFSGTYIRDTRDNALDARRGLYQSYQLDFNARILGSSVSFAKLLLQTSYYRPVTENIVWANSLRVGLAQYLRGSHVPISERFFTGGGSTLRGFPLNGAGPQRTVAACNDPADPATCSLIRVPAGGTQLLIFNSEFRFPLPLRQGLTMAAFYDGGNVFHPIGFHRFRAQYTNSVGIGFRYATPVGPVRIDIGRNLNRVEGIKATQIFVTLGQAF